ncbi:MAG: imidazole glycerol phosphate synthase subunit HisH [Thermoanaerobaculia bacterium]
MSGEIQVIDLGVGNLGNVARALAAAGGQPRLTSDPEEIRRARRLLLPGVGAFRPPRERLRGTLEAALRAALADGAWLLGICVGYQLLFESSTEFGELDGLALLPGRITELPAGVPRPHIGWNRIVPRRAHPLLDGIDSGSYVYYVHSYAADAGADGAALATTRHGRTFAAVAGGSAAAGSGRVFGAQFHPEKSGATGLRFLANFLALATEGTSWS